MLRKYLHRVTMYYPYHGNDEPTIPSGSEATLVMVRFIIGATEVVAQADCKRTLVPLIVIAFFGNANYLYASPAIVICSELSEIHRS